LRILIISIVLLLIFGASVFASDAKSNPNEYYLFAVDLFDQRDYYRAVTEFKRYAFYSRTTDGALRTDYAVAACYQNAREWPRAIDAWRMLMLKHSSHAVVNEAAYRLAECMIANEDYVSAVAVLDRYAEEADAQADYIDDACFLKGIALLAQRKWAAGAAQFELFRSSYPNSALADSAKSILSTATKLETMPSQSPAKAALLSSFVPGLGQGYAGRPGDGWTAFLVNAAIAGFTINRFDRGDHSAAYPMLLMATTFYAGNVHGAARAAVSVNREREDQLIGKAMNDISQTVGFKLGHPDRLRPWDL